MSFFNGLELISEEGTSLKSKHRTNGGIKEAKPTIIGKELQNGDIANNMLYHTQKILNGFAESRKCIYTHFDSSVVQKIPMAQLKRKSITVLGTAIWSVSQPTHFHQNFTLVIGIGEITENKDLGIIGQSPYYRRNKRKM
ncbi:hypothetical protein BB561_003462, partial [Smittium simulii]